MCETEDNCDLSEQIPYCYDHFRKGKIPRIARIRQGRNHLLSVDPSPPDPLHYDRHPFDARRVGRFGAAGRLSGAGPRSGLAVPHRVRRGPAAPDHPRPGPRGAALYGRRGCRPLLRTVLRRGRDGVHARADRAADSRQPAGHGPQLHAHAPQFFGLSRRRRTAFRRVHRAAGRGVQRLPAAPRGRPEHRVVLHAHPALGLQQDGPQAAGRAGVAVRRGLYGRRPHAQTGHRRAAHRPSEKPRPAGFGCVAAGPRPVRFQLLHAWHGVRRHGFSPEKGHETGRSTTCAARRGSG